ncbi:hypothetical protein AB4K20DRAFT_1887745 [Rhizopus microsporus]
MFDEVINSHLLLNSYTHFFTITTSDAFSFLSQIFPLPLYSHPYMFSFCLCKRLFRLYMVRPSFFFTFSIYGLYLYHQNSACQKENT